MEAQRERIKDPPTSPPSEGGGGGWRLLTTAKDSVTAYLIEGRLAEEGIESFLDKSNPSPGAFLKPFGDPLAPVKVFVKTSDYEQASLLLHEAEHVPDDPNVVGRGVKRLWLLTILVVLAAALLAFMEMFGDAPCLVGICLR